jgi:hypothetical protein
MKSQRKKQNYELEKDFSISDALGQLGRSLVDGQKEVRDTSFRIPSVNKFSDFDEEPVALDKFLYGSSYLNLSITLSSPQFNFIDNCSRIFGEPIYTEGVLQCGQGSGKDTCSVFLCLYLVYLLQCLSSPQKYFGIGQQSFIDIINVAPTEAIAKNIFFDTLKNCMAESPFFRQLNPDLTTRIISFPKNIRLISGNSKDESWQGYTPILIILDEIDAFKGALELVKKRSLRAEGAEGVYGTAKALVQSRFPGRGKVLSLSWPRYKDSFIQKRFKQGRKEEKTYVASKENGQPYATWEFNPSKKEEDFVDFFRDDPVLAAARFRCEPSFSRDSFIKDTEYVLLAFDAELDELDNIIWAQKKNIRRNGIRSIYDLNSKNYHYIHVDLGLTQANAAICVCHSEGENVIIDLVEVWSPRPGVDVDINSIRNFIVDLNKDIMIEEVTYDGYQSVASIQSLQAMNINASYQRTNKEVYDTFKDILYQERLDGYFDEPTVREILSLERIYGDKIEAPPGMLKDRADAIASAVYKAVKGLDRGTMKSIGEIGGMFASPPKSDNIDVGEYMRKLTVSDVFISSIFCPNCNQKNSMEMLGINGRVETEQEATAKWCLSCRGSWSRSFLSEQWVVFREPTIKGQ